MELLAQEGMQMNWTPDALLDGLYEEAEAERARKREETPAGACREELRLQLRKALGAFPASRAPLEAELLEEREYEGYTLQRVAYTTMEAVRVPVMVLIPAKGAGPWPAVLACHGHGRGYLDAAGLAEDGRELPDPGIHNRFAVRLAREGMLAVVPEIMGFGERRTAADQLDNKPNSCGYLAAQLLMYGRTLAGMRVYEAMRALDYMQSRPDIAPDRLGIFGFSGGGLVSALTAALDERVRAAVLCGWTNTFRGSIVSRLHCMDNYLPGILTEAEQPELAGLIAPRPLFMESGDKDTVFPVEHALSAAEELARIYGSLNVPERFGCDIFPGVHEISGRQSIGWLSRQLQL